MGHVLCVHERGKNWWLAYLLCNCLQMKTRLWEYHDAFVPDPHHPLWWHYQRQQEWDVPFLIVFMSYLSPFVWLVIFIFFTSQLYRVSMYWEIEIKTWLILIVCDLFEGSLSGSDSKLVLNISLLYDWSNVLSIQCLSVHGLQLYEVFFEMTKARIVCFVYVVFVFLFDFPPFQFVKSVHIVSSHNDLKKCMIFLQKHHVHVVNIFCDHDTIKWHPWGGVASFFAAIWCLLSCKKNENKVTILNGDV